MCHNTDGPQHTALGERRQTHRATGCVTPWLGNAQNRQIHRQNVDLWVSRWGVTANGDGVSFRVVECSRTRQK